MHNNEQEMQKLANEYAGVAEQLLQQNGNPYTEEDVIKVAEFLIDQDYPEEQEKTAAEQLQEIRMAAFNDELEKNAASVRGALDALSNLYYKGKAYAGLGAHNAGQWARTQGGRAKDLVMSGYEKGMAGAKAAPGYIHGQARGLGETVQALGARQAADVAYLNRIGGKPKAGPKAMAWLNKVLNKPGQHAVGYGTAALGTGAVLGAGYGVKKALD